MQVTYKNAVFCLPLNCFSWKRIGEIYFLETTKILPSKEYNWKIQLPLTFSQPPLRVMGNFSRRNSGSDQSEVRVYSGEREKHIIHSGKRQCGLDTTPTFQKWP